MIGVILTTVSAIFLQTTGGFQGQQGDAIDILGVGAAIFALILLSLSIFAWSKRRQTSLILVSLVFVLFFFKIFLEIFPSEGNNSQLFSVMLDFLILTLLFLAIVVRPRIKRSPTNDVLPEK